MAYWGPLSMAQDLIRCTLCEDAPVELNCNTCNIGLCARCVSGHITSKMSSKHDIVPFTAKKSKIEFPKCKSHSNIECNFYCRQCNVPVCSECVINLHKMHDLCGISETIASAIADIQQETAEIDTVLTEEYTKIKTETKMKRSKIQNEYLSLKKSISDHGKVWHRELDSIVAQFIKDVKRMENEDLSLLDKQLTELECILTEIRNTSLKNKEILSSYDANQMLNHRTRKEEFCKVPIRVELSPPSFAPLNFEGLDLMKQFGSLTSSIKTEVSEYIIDVEESIASLSSVGNLLDFPKEVSTTNTGDEIRSMTTLKTDQMWIGRLRSLDRVDIHGTTLEKINILSGSFPRGPTMTKEGHLIYTDYTDNTVNLVKRGKIEVIIRTGDWEPSSVCSTSTGNLLVCLYKDKSHKVVRYSASKAKQEIKFDEKKKPLFAEGYGDMFIAENRDQNICVSDPNAHKVLVLNQGGKLQFRYDGNLASKKYKSFYPMGIDTDSQCQILIADRDNHCVHIINCDGKFLSYIDNCQLNAPVGLSVDSSDRLFISHGSSSVKIIKYMK